MKMYLSLTLIAILSLITTACRTTQLNSHSFEKRTIIQERADSLIVKDSVIVFVHEKADTVRIVQLKTRWRERVTLRHDTLTIIKTDTIRIIEPKVRSPAKTVKTWIRTISVTIVIIIIIITITKIKRLWDKLI